MRKFIALALTVLVALAAAVCVTASPTASLRQEAVRVQIDILPGVAPNAIDLGDIQAVPVAILSTAGFDAASVNAASVTVGGAPVTKTDDGQLSVSRDVNEDGLADVVIYFSPMFTQLDNTSTEAALRGSLNDGTPVESSDAVQCSGRAPQTAGAGPGVAPLATIRLPPALALSLFGDIYNYVASFFAAPVETTQTFSNTNNISIPVSGNASPYPSNISVSGFPATEKVKSVTVSLSKINHTAPDDLDILLVGPDGQKFILMSDRGGNNDLVNTNLTFDDAAAALLPVSNILSGTYRPTNQTNSGDNFSGVATPYLSPAPVGTATLFSAFGGANANGTWSLYVVDDNSGDSGNISGGWSITITTEPSDSTPPVISTPTVANVEATGPAGAVVTFAAPTADDNVDGVVSVNCVSAPTAGLASGSTFPLGTTFIACTATDAAGNPAEKIFSVTVEDTTAPAFSDTPADSTHEATSAAGAAVTFFNPTATDIVSGSVSVSCVSAPTAGLASGSTFPLGTTAVNCSATDAAGNAANTSFSVTVADTQGPVISNVPGNQTLEATSAAGAAATWTDPTATDAVDGARPVVCTPLAGSPFPLGTTTVNCEASDNSSHTSSASFTIKVQDTTAPALTVPANQTAEATSAAGAVVNFPAATATDAVTASPTINYSQNPGTAFPVGTTTVNVSATDAAGNVSNGSFTVTVKDTTAPAMPALSPVNAEATSAAGAVVNYSVGTATDAVDGNVALVCAPASGATFALGATTVNCSATDTAGNASNGSFTVTVSDTTAPALSVPANQVAEATSAAGAAVSYPAATATDAVTSAPEITYSHASGSVFPLGTTTVTVKAKDAAGNESTGSFEVTVEDTTAPVLTVPAAQVVAEATSAAGAAVSFTASAADAVDATPSVNCTPASGSTFALGTTQVSCTASDDAGNTSAPKTFSVKVQDTTAPSFTTSPADQTIEATGPAGAVATFTAAASDLVDGPVTVSFDKSSGSTFALGATTVNYTATDAAGNQAAGSFVITVRDTTAPSLDLPTDITKEATGPATPVSFTATATDIVDGNVNVICTPASGSSFGVGTTTINCTATDAAGNAAPGSFNVKITDTTAPAMPALAPVVAEATSAAGAVVTYTVPPATDLVDGNVALVCTPASNTQFALGATTVNCTATDAAGNASNGNFTVTVQDTTGPAISGVPGDMTAEATSASGAEVSYTNPTANDLVDGAVQVNCSPSSGATFALGATTVNCSAVDAAGNSSSASFTVTVEDTTAPALSVPADQTEEATGPSGAAVSYPAATATDAVTSAPEITYSHASGSVFPLGTTTVTVKAKDAAGNESTDTFTVTVEDTTAPTITVPANQTAEATGAAGVAVTFAAPSASDIVDGALTPNCVSAPTAGLASGSTFPLGTTTITCNVSDAADNAAAQKSFTVTVQDTTAPTLSGLTNKTVEATGPTGAVATYSPSATDLVDGGVAVNCSPVSGSTFAIGAATVNCSATDAHNNTANGSFTVTVKDTTAPVLNLPANVTALAASNSKAAVNYTATATDVVDGSVSVNCAPASGSLFSVGTTTVNCSATDAHGNTANGSFTVAVSYNFNGFFQPVDNLPVLNKAQAGSAIPVKFSLGGNQGLSIFATPNSPGSAMVGCGATSLVSEVEQTVTAGGSSLSYDPVANQYVYVWKTDKSWAGTCRQLVVTFADGTVKGANFQFRK